jgi:hypothetical protein
LAFVTFYFFANAIQGNNFCTVHFINFKHHVLDLGTTQFLVSFAGFVCGLDSGLVGTTGESMKTEQGGWRETRDTKSRGKRSVEREDNERNGKNQCLVHSRNVCWSKHACRPHIEQWAGCFGLPRHAPKVHFPEGCG